MRLPSRHHAGVTILDLLVVIAILIVLAGVAIVAGNSARMRAYNTQALVCGEQIRKAQTLYYSENQTFADAFSKLNAQMVARCALVSVVEVSATPQGYTYTVAHQRGNTKYTVEDDRASQTTLAGGAENAAGASDTSGGGSVVQPAPPAGTTPVTLSAQLTPELGSLGSPFTVTVTGGDSTSNATLTQALTTQMNSAVTGPVTVTQTVTVNPGTYAVRVTQGANTPTVTHAVTATALRQTHIVQDYYTIFSGSGWARPVNTILQFEAVAPAAATPGGLTYTLTVPTAGTTFSYAAGVSTNPNYALSGWARVPVSSNIRGVTLVVAHHANRVTSTGNAPACTGRCWEVPGSGWTRTGQVTFTLTPYTYANGMTFMVDDTTNPAMGTAGFSGTYRKFAVDFVPQDAAQPMTVNTYTGHVLEPRVTSSDPPQITAATPVATTLTPGSVLELSMPIVGGHTSTFDINNVWAVGFGN